MCTGDDVVKNNSKIKRKIIFPVPRATSSHHLLCYAKQIKKNVKTPGWWEGDCEKTAKEINSKQY